MITEDDTVTRIERRYVSTEDRTMPTVTTPSAETHSITLYRHDAHGARTARRVIVDAIDRDDLASFVRGAIADAYHAGRNDERAEATR